MAENDGSKPALYSAHREAMRNDANKKQNDFVANDGKREQAAQQQEQESRQQEREAERLREEDRQRYERRSEKQCDQGGAWS
ncbi:hypothetical protein VE04_05018 [Pseudogymnoascus sp. 24MN13]|nr:hypothetical protein VE04_05018 [Pseudogymnoascus sp. 24MN13]